MDKYRQIGTEEDGVTELMIRDVRKQKNLLEWSRRVADCRWSNVSVSRCCSEHDINRNTTTHGWPNKVFTAMIEQQELQMMATAESEGRFVELPSLPARNEAVATVRVGMATHGASTELATALCKALNYTE